MVLIHLRYNSPISLGAQDDVSFKSKMARPRGRLFYAEMLRDVWM